MKLHLVLGVVVEIVLVMLIGRLTMSVIWDELLRNTASLINSGPQRRSKASPPLWHKPEC